MLNYELWTELLHFKICELNFELVHVESELSQHCNYTFIKTGHKQAAHVYQYF